MSQNTIKELQSHYDQLSHVSTVHRVAIYFEIMENETVTEWKKGGEMLRNLQKVWESLENNQETVCVGRWYRIKNGDLNVPLVLPL